MARTTPAQKPRGSQRRILRGFFAVMAPRWGRGAREVKRNGEACGGPALAILAARFRLFTASNGNADLAKIGIAHLFERNVAARHVGALKPDPAIFHKTIEGTGLAPDEVAYVGDDPLMDVVGARRAGMLPIWINREGAAWPADIEPATHVITSLDDLVELTAASAAARPDR